jgi:CubicO group peptidase (beta-lactamase class C family)
MRQILLRDFLTLVAVALAAGQILRANEVQEEKLHAFIQQGMQDWSLTGLAVAVVKDDKVVFARGYGVRDVRTKAAVNEHTVFQIGSCSKPLTAAGAALLVQDGRIEWDTPIIERWRDFQVADPVVTKQATLRDILCHRTGVGKGEGALYHEMPISRSDLLKRLSEVKQAAPFRTEWRYSGAMFAAAGRVIEETAGESWDDTMSTRLFQPLGMTRTHTSIKALTRIDNVATPHVRVNDETFVTEFADRDNIGPGASISSSAHDLSQWLLMMVNEGRHKGQQILKPGIVREMVKPQILVPFADPVHGEHAFDASGLGLMLQDYHGQRIAFHAGMVGHSLAIMGFVPEKRVGVVVLTNHRRCLFHYAAFRRALDLYCGMPPVDLDSANKKLLAELQIPQATSLRLRAAARDSSKKPTLPLENYRGTFKGEYDSLATLEREASGAVLRYGNFVADVVHWHDDTFRARLRQRRLADEQDWYLTFTVAKGAIVKLHIHSEHDVHADFVPVAPPQAKTTSKLGPDRPVPHADRFAGMDPYIHAALEKWQVPGLAIAVVKGGEIVLARGYGVCEIGTDRKVSADTAFTLASSAKSFTAAALGMLVEEGKLRWDDPVVKHLPDFELADPYLTKHVTLRDLLCHRTGVRRADLLGDGAGFDTKEIMRRLKLLEPIAELRTQYIYNNHMYTVLGEVVSRVSGQPWEQFVAERIHRPLGMKSTTATPTKILPERLAPRHWRSDAGIVARPIEGGMYSTVRDMAQWLKLQLAEGAFEGGRLLKPETVREMHALQFSVPLPAPPKDNFYAAHFYGCGLGWFTQDYRGCKVVLHGGAWGAMVAMVPEEKLGVVVLSNLDLESLPGLLMYDVFDAYLVGPDTAWNRDKWGATWLRNEPPGHAFRPRDEAKARLEKLRTPGTKPKRPLERYAGAFDSPLYGRLVVRHEGGRLFVTFGKFTTEMAHWQDESFYVRTPTRLTFDWLLTFGGPEDQVASVMVKHVGWDNDEKDQQFVRGK